MSANRAMLTAVACVALLLGVLAPGSGAQTEPAPPPLVGGGATPVGSPSPYPDVAYIEMLFPGGQQASCTATLVDPEWLLTAAHCLQSNDNLGPDLFAIDLPFIILGSANAATDINNPGPGVEFHEPAGFIIHGEYDPLTFDNDVALIKLAQPSSITPRQIATNTALTVPASDGASLPGQVLGFGGTCVLPCASFSSDFTLREGPTTLRTADYARNTIGAAVPGAIDDSTIIAVPSTAQAGLCPGDSGGPLFVDDGGTLKLAGVNSHLYFGVNGFCAPFDGSVYVNGFADIVGSNLADWVNQIVNAAPRTCLGAPVTLMGSTYPDKLIGTAGVDSIHGDRGADVIYGYASGDHLCGGKAGDLIVGGSGPDQIAGHSGRDTIDGDSGADVIDGGSAGDDIAGGTGADVITGGTGHDIIFGNGGTDTIFGEGGDDIISGGKKGDVISGGKGDDDISGNSGRDDISGKSGNDVISGGSAADTISGGTGVDACSGGTGADVITSCE